MDDHMMTKRTLRKHLIQARRKMPAAPRNNADLAIARTVLARPEVARAKTISLYISLPEEVDTQRVLIKFFKQGKTIVVPRVAGRRHLTLHRIRSMQDLVPGVFSIREPKKTCAMVDASSVDVFVVPGIAFDRQGYRLGWGKGYYDRLLRDVNATRIGLAYHCQIVPRLSHRSYDIPMNVVVTEMEVYGKG